jgi:hypothetical protein
MINILTFNEWKESDDYKIHQWFINKKLSITKWFEDEAFAGLEFDYFEFDTTNSLYELYTGELYFNEDTIQWTMSFMIDPANLNEGAVESLKVILKGSDKETQDPMGSIERDIDEPEITPDLLIEMINEFKTEHINQEND